MRVRSHTPRSIAVVHPSVVWMLTLNWGGVMNTTACWQPVLTTLVDEKAHVSAPCHVEKWKQRVLKNVMSRRERCAKKRSTIIIRDCPSTQSLTIQMCLFQSTCVVWKASRPVGVKESIPNGDARHLNWKGVEFKRHSRHTVQSYTIRFCNFWSWNGVQL